MRKQLYILLTALAFIGCANRGIGPQGGPKDSIPPVPVRSFPENGAVSFTGNNIEVLFNEYIQLDNIAQNLLMSPPQQNPPDVKARGKRLMVHFVDSLRDSTTYTLDFGNAVCDFTEKNPLRGYTFAFSTGPVIDTLEILGSIINAEDLNPVMGVLAGIHSDQADSAFTSTTFDRIARSDSAGVFRISNIHEGTYRLYALDDVSRDYRWNVGEGLAYAEESITPSPNDTLAYILWYFCEQRQRLYLQRTLRDKQHVITLLFSSSPDSLPTWRALRPSEVDSAASDTAWVDPTPYILPQYYAHNDTIMLWLTDSLAIAQDTILLEARYRRTDSIYQLEWYTDTLRAVWRAPRMTEKAKVAKARQDRNRRLELKSNAKQNFEIYDTISVTCTTPLAQITGDSIHLFLRVDTVQKPLPFELIENQMSFQVVAKLEPGQKYELCLDSAAMYDIYGVCNNKANFTAQLKKTEDYSTLRIKLKPFVPQARIQLLNSKDQIVRELPADEAGAFFQYLKPDTYYLRLYMDDNSDGKWTTGCWEEHRQPEPVYYYPEKIQTKSNWDFEEEWDYQTVPQLQSKPKELIKVSDGKKNK
ncbi:MAG: Ig-like domain-containing protein [Paludibacteraceae bacterium]|nr:Ig-like domain-containing protein [Paludibacteraceae bacterium]